MADYFIDILEPGEDTNAALDSMGRAIGNLYLKSWNEIKSKHYPGKTFSLNIQALALMWLKGQLKIFVAVDKKTNEAIGFLSGVVYRPLYYEAQLFQVQDWYAAGDEEMEKALFDYTVKAVRILGCNELWIQDEADIAHAPVPDSWQDAGELRIKRFIKKG